MSAFYDWAEGEALGDQHRTVHNELGYIKRGTGSPEGVVTADIGSLFIRSDGGASSVLYVKESGTGNTGWVALGSIASIDHGTLTGLADDDHPQYMTSAETDTSIATHAGLADPHTGYRLESADHTHATTGLQAGQLDHGTALTGLTDDDHTQYRLESVDHTHQTTGAEAGKLDHGLALNGLTDDDHTQYLLKTSVDAVTFTIGVFFDGNGAALATGVRPIWRAPFACTVTQVRAYVDTGTTTVVNAGSGAASAADFCSADITIDPSDAWETGTVNQNQSISAGDTISVEIVTAGTATQVTIQIELTRDLSP